MKEPITGLATITSKNTSMIPNRSIISMPLRANSGANAYKTRDPSSGGIGIILNIKKPKLTPIANVKNCAAKPVNGVPISTYIPKNINASSKLVNGPAIATSAAPHSPYFTRAGLKGTGFAPPNIGPPLIAKMIGRSIVRNGSICLIGFKLNRPSSFAVSSPSMYAVSPCTTSCRVIEKNITTKTITICNISILTITIIPQLDVNLKKRYTSTD